jgi:tetratricopeptide (TPR) repeat protein
MAHETKGNCQQPAGPLAVVEMRYTYISALAIACFTPALTSCGGMIKKGAVISAQKFYDQGQYDKALRQLALADENNSEAILLKARSHEARGEKDLARGYYTVLVKQHPDSAEAVVAQQKLR